MEYKNIDILKSKTNISTLKQQIFDSERFISNTYFQEINNNWKSKSRHNFQNNLTLFINELKEFDKLMSETTITLDDIQKYVLIAVGATIVLIILAILAFKVLKKKNN